MKAHETVSPPRDFSDQEIVFGKLLGSIPTERAATNGLIIRHGYIVVDKGGAVSAETVAKATFSPSSVT